MTHIRNFVFNELGVNSFVMYDDTKECILIDPGCNHEKQQQQLTGFISAQSLVPRYIVLTHGHFDHVAGLTWAIKQFGCPVMMHAADLFLVEAAVQQADFFGFEMDAPPSPDAFLGHGDLIRFGNSQIEVIHVPGHSPGSICLYDSGEHILVCGDVLFSGSIGRTDLFGGNHDQLIDGIREKLMVLPRETVVWPGHGPSTSIGNEYDTNPFLT